MPKFFFKKEQIDGDMIYINGEDANHIANVLRAKENDEIIICDGEGTDHLCTIVSIDKKSVMARIKEKKKNENEPETKITLYQGIAKGERMDTAIQKSVEIGVSRIVPVITEHTVVKISGKEEKKTERWNKISESAAKQCGRGIIPKVENAVLFKDAVKEAAQSGFSIIPYENEDTVSMRDVIKDIESRNINIFIGPEGGFSESEIRYAKENSLKTVTLGKRILRTETAGLVASVILLYELKDK